MTVPSKLFRFYTIRPNDSAYKYQVGRNKNHWAKLLVVPSGRMSSIMHKLKYNEFHLIRNKSVGWLVGLGFFYSGSDQAYEEIAQRTYGVSIPGDL